MFCILFCDGQQDSAPREDAEKLRKARSRLLGSQGLEVRGTAALARRVAGGSSRVVRAQRTRVRPCGLWGFLRER